MNAMLFVVLALPYVFALQNPDDFINEINSKQNLWLAGKNYRNTPVRRFLGIRSKLPQNVLDSIPVMKHEINESDGIPETFDARIKWNQCKSIKYVPDQSSCGSGWAISVASAISDRICIQSNGRLQPVISAKHLLSCTMASHGCRGGQEIMAWREYESNGVVSGGPFESNIGCKPYPFPPCDHVGDGSKEECNFDPFDTPLCTKSCDNSSIKFEQDLHFSNATFFLSNNETLMQVEMMRNGPVVAVLKVYTDFNYYRNGVYSYVGGQYEGSHAIRLIGWGVENGTNYWLAVNSWNEEWGDKGLFKIRRGVNEVGIESEVTAGFPKL